MRKPEEGEAADVLVAIGAEQNIARFMVMYGLDCVTEIQELSKETIALYANEATGPFSLETILLDLEGGRYMGLILPDTLADLVSERRGRGSSISGSSSSGGSRGSASSSDGSDRNG